MTEPSAESWLTVKRGAVYEPEWGPYPWGWLPAPS